MTYKTLTLKRGKEESLKRFHPWIFSGALVNMPEDIEEGETVKVYTHSGAFIAIGHFQVGLSRCVYSLSVISPSMMPSGMPVSSRHSP